MQPADGNSINYATVSIRCRSEHTLPKTLDAIAAAGFQAIELGSPGLLAFAGADRQAGPEGLRDDNHDS